VRRQLADCRAEAARRGWSVAEEYVDDDVSAWSAKRRPAYERMLADIAAGRRDAVIVWHTDRLHRRPIELEHFIDVCTRAGVGVVSPSGEFDMANGDGLFVLRLMAAVAANESDSKRRRGQRKALEIAQSGRPLMGGPRPFGFLDDRVTHHPGEAPVIRDLAGRLLAGESLTSVARWLDEAGVRTVGGNAWKIQTIRGLMTNPRIWGVRVHQGHAFGPAVWEPIITAEQGERLRRLLLDPTRRTNRTARRYLLSGMLRCGKCGKRMVSTPKAGVRRYGCMPTVGIDGCGGVFIYAQMLEEFIAEAVLQRLDSPALHRAMTQAPDGDERAAALADAIEADQAKMTDLAAMFADGEVSREEWKAARDRIEPRLTANRAEFARVTQRDAAAAYVGRADELRATWATLNLSRQVAIVKAVLDYATILPAATPGRRGLDPSRVVPTWRV